MSRWIPYKIQIEREDSDITVHGFISLSLPEFISGPPELCHPAEGPEIEIVGAVDCNGSPVDLTPAEIKQAVEVIWNETDNAIRMWQERRGETSS